MVEAMRRDGQYYALPTAVRSLALFWNERLFEEAGLDPAQPPQTLDELVEYAEALTQRDGAGNLTQVGLTMGMTAQDHHWWREVLVRQFGGEPYVDDYRTVNYDSEAGRQALAFYTGLITDHGVSQIGFMDEPQAAFKAGRAGYAHRRLVPDRRAAGHPRPELGGGRTAGRARRHPVELRQLLGQRESRPRPRANATTPRSSSWST